MSPFILFYGGEYVKRMEADECFFFVCGPYRSLGSIFLYVYATRGA